ncbi:hypothetical protein [Calothrix sp. PCC 7507]|uniref:hypothetical protein n=1 Tax=Calothrix sp. PCC 7507 TaxID=99598 RepID=UPI00029F48F8|nr:hypothetical protein [Calothrix sp. PCC 7507]AFY32998.1 hypothetical protein Cal7507_2575 [Calothrix sp. PCC 7507]
MKVAVQQEDLQLLAKTLQEQLLAAAPSGQAFQVKCAVKNDELMILTQHPANVTVDTETIFQLLEEALQSLPSYWEQRVQCFLRISGENRPYAQRWLTLHEEDRGGGSEPEQPISPSADHQIHETVTEEGDFSNRTMWGIGVIEAEGESEQPIFPPVEDAILSSYESNAEPESEEEEAFDPLAGGPDLSSSKSARLVKPILLGVALVGIVLSGGAYLLTRPCVISECKELQTAEQLKTESRQMIRRAKSEKDLVVLQQQLNTASSSLTIIPSWSPHYRAGEELKASLSTQSEKIDQVVKALQGGSLAVQKTQIPAKSLEELQARQNLWRQAIAPLEAIDPQSDVYGLVQPKLFRYRVSLKNVNEQLLVEAKWLKKLTAAQAVASAATKQETAAKSLNDWQKAQSTWQVVINALNAIPQTSSGYQQAQALLTEYKPKLAAARDRATQEQLAAKTYQQAVGTASQAKAAEQNNQLPAAVVRWGQALQAAKQISRDSSYYTQAQSLIEPYSLALKQAQEKLQSTSNPQQTLADLQKTCTSSIPICTFTVDKRAIIIQLTDAYDKIRQSGLANPELPDSSKASGIKQYWENLQDALAIISDNANLPLLVYDSQGRPVYTRSRQG